MAAAGKVVLAGAAWACLLALAGCGSSPGAAADSDSADTARFELVITRKGEQGRLVMSGSYDYVRERGTMTAKLEGTEDADTDVPNEMRFFGDTAYTQQEHESKTYWVEEKDSAEGVGYPDQVIVPFPATGSDPKEALELILTVGEDKAIGSAELRGEETTRYEVRLDPKDLSRELGRPLDDVGGVFTVDVWGDDAGRLRRIRFADDGTQTFDFFDFGTAVEVERPPESQVVSDAEFDKISQPTEEEQLELCKEEIPEDVCEDAHGEGK